MNISVKENTPLPASGEQETTERLLDAAERLFGEHGYDAVGMRMLAQEAKVNLGATTYHYGSKESLYIQTFMRRFRPANAERLRLLREAEARAAAEGRTVPVEKIVDCMVRPPFLQGREHPHFHALLARSLFMPPPFLHAALHRELEPNARVFIEAFRHSLPDVPVDLIDLRTMFSMGALLMFSVQMGKWQTARNPRFEESILKEMVRFISSGLQSEPAVAPRDRRLIPRPSKPPRG